MAAKVIFVNQNVKSQSFKLNLFGPEKNRVKVANVLAAFKSSVAIMDDGSVMEADEDGLSMDTFVAGGTYTLSLEQPGQVTPEQDDHIKKIVAEQDDHINKIVAEQDENIKKIVAEQDDNMKKIVAEQDDHMKKIVAEQDDHMKKIVAEMDTKFAEFLKALAPKKSYRISEANSTVWRNIQSSVGFLLEHWEDVFDAAECTERIVPAFRWADSMENAQAVEYVSYIQRQLVKSSRKWSVINGNEHPNLLDNDLGGMKFKGTVDVAVVVKAAQSLPATGLKIIFELKKVEKVNAEAEYRTIVSLVLANSVCGHYRPVAMLSDLVDQWIFFWMDGFKVRRHKFATRSKAVGYLDSIFKGDFEPEDQSHDMSALRTVGESSSRGFKRTFLERQRFWPPEMERLEELANFLPEDELRQGRAAIGLQYALKMPGFYSVISDMQESSKPFVESMYS